MNFSSGNFRGKLKQNGARESSFNYKNSENNLPLVRNYKNWRVKKSLREPITVSQSLQPMEDTFLRLPRTRNAFVKSLIVKHKENADIHNLLYGETNQKILDGKTKSRDQPEINFGENSFQPIVKNEMDSGISLNKPKQCSHTETSPKTSLVKLRNVADNEVHFTDSIHRRALENVGCGAKCKGSLMGTLGKQPPKSKEDILTEAEDFFNQYFTSMKRNDSSEHSRRWQTVKRSIEETGTYHMTTEELTFGAKTGWRNAPRCIGRIQWSNLQVFDARDVTTARGMFEAVCRHIRFATNNGKIRSTITFFRERTDVQHDFRVWNVHLIMYAGYRQPDGSVIGDPMHVDFTEVCMKLGWKGKYGMFDVLPLVVQANGGEPEFFEYPKEIILETEITHPRFPRIKQLGLRWYCLPAVANMMFDCGGLQFTASPFNGWYMATEVAARDFCDKHRYNLIEKLATAMNFDTRSNLYMWQDQTVVEMNVAVLHSFQNVGATIVDHHTASESFMTFMQNEYKQRGGCPADWVWIVPPISGSLTSVFHQEMLLFKLKPSYEYQDEAWKTWRKEIQMKQGITKRRLSFKTIASAVFQWIRLMRQCMGERVKCTILFATETGKSETFAKTLHKIFRQTFDSRILNMDQYSLVDLRKEALVLFVTSTFGNGDPPENAKQFAHDITTVKDLPIRMNGGKNGDIINGRRSLRTPNGRSLSSLGHIKFSVFGLGSRAYPKFCAFSHFIDRTMETLGATRIYSLGEGDELSGQEESFRNWAKNTYQVACRSYNIGSKSGVKNDASDVLEKTDTSWSPGKYRIVMATDRPLPLQEELERLFKKIVFPCRLKERKRLDTRGSSRRTILAKIDIRQHLDAMQYSPGDHVLLYPENSPKLVYQLIRLLDDVPPENQQIMVERRAHSQGSISEISSWKPHDRLPVGTLESLLTTYLDITTPPTQEFLSLLSTLAESAEDRIKIKRLVNSSLAYNEWKNYGMPSVPDTMKMFRSLRVPAAFLLTQLPLLQPRYYSISSSLDACPGEVHVTAEVVEYQTQDGSLHKGVCSNYLNDLPIGENIMCSIRVAPLFHLPKDQSVPILMVGPGTGIAPFRSFWMQRKFDTRYSRGYYGSTYGEMFLYFGCRNATDDNIYVEELQICERERTLTKCFYAFSREVGIRKTYVQDLLNRNGRDVYRKLIIEKGHLYICGNVQMASDVKAMVRDIIMTLGGINERQADEYLYKMKDDNRLHEDIFGLAVRKRRSASARRY